MNGDAEQAAPEATPPAPIPLLTCQACGQLAVAKPRIRIDDGSLVGQPTCETPGCPNNPRGMMETVANARDRMRRVGPADVRGAISAADVLAGRQTSMTDPPESPTRFAWRMLGSPPWPPPAPKRGLLPATHAQCWLCGGDATSEPAWTFQAAIAPTFTNHTLAAAPWSQTICQPCAYFAHGDSWRDYCYAHVEPFASPADAWLRSRFPALALVLRCWAAHRACVQPLSWRSNHHLFSADGQHLPSRRDWRRLLLNPPAPPFLAVLTETGKKHSIFRGRVSYDRERYCVLLEEEPLWVERLQFAAVLAAFEALYARGFSKDSIVSGDYHPAQLMKVGVGTWRRLEAPMAAYRRQCSGLVRLAHFVAQREETS